MPRSPLSNGSALEECRFTATPGFLCAPCTTGAIDSGPDRRNAIKSNWGSFRLATRTVANAGHLPHSSPSFAHTFKTRPHRSSASQLPELPIHDAIFPGISLIYVDIYANGH